MNDTAVRPLAPSPPAPPAPSHAHVDTTRTIEVIAGGALAGVAAVHLADLSSKFAEVPYLGVAYVALIAGSIASIALVLRRDLRGWMLGGGLALATIIGFVLSRTIGLPAATDDIGNWSEPLGTWSLIVESIVVALAAHTLYRHRGGPSARSATGTIR